MSTKGSPLKTVNMAPLGDLFSLEQRCDNNSGFSDNDSRNATGKDSQLVKHTNQYHPPHGYGYPLSQQLFPSAPPLYQHSPFNVTHSSLQPTTSISQRFPSYGPLWEGYHLHHGSYGESQMFSQQLFPGEGPSSPGALRVPPGPPWNNTVNRPTFPALLLLLDLLPAHLGELPIASRWNDSCGLRYHGKQISYKSQTRPHCRRVRMRIMIQMVTRTISQTWAVENVNPQSAWSKQNYPWCNLPKEWGMPTIVHSTSGRKYGWLGFSRNSIGPLSRCRPV